MDRSFQLPVLLQQLTNKYDLCVTGQVCSCVMVFLYPAATFSIWCIPVCLSACLLSICISLLPVHLLVCHSFSVPSCFPSWLLVCLPVCLSACLSVCLSVGLSVCLSVCLPVSLFVCLSTVCMNVVLLCQVLFFILWCFFCFFSGILVPSVKPWAVLFVWHYPSSHQGVCKSGSQTEGTEGKTCIILKVVSNSLYFLHRRWLSQN